MDSAIWGFTGVIIGGLITISAEILRIRASRSISEAQRNHEIQIQNDNFQRENLLNLQDVLGRWKLVQHKALETDEQCLKDFGHLLPVDMYLQVEIKELRPLLRLRVERTTDNALRRALTELVNQADLLESLRTKKAVRAELDKQGFRPNVLSQLYLEAEVQLGTILRKYL